jgi:hypothetical protein
MRAIDLLPQVFDPRRVLVLEQLEQRRNQRGGDLRFEPGDLAVAGHAMVGLDLDVHLGPAG